MSNDLEHWERQLRELRQSSQGLSAALMTAAAELRAAGTEPPAELLVRLERYRARFDELRNDLRQRFAVPESAASLQDLEQSLSQQKQVQAALDLVESAERLRHREVAGFPPLHRVWEQCQNLREQLQSSPNPQTADDLLNGQHPLAALIQLVREGDSLSDERWERLQEVVATQFGRDLATAVIRGRVTESAA